MGFWTPLKGTIYAALRIKAQLVAKPDQRLGEDYLGNPININQANHILCIDYPLIARTNKTNINKNENWTVIAFDKTKFTAQRVPFEHEAMADQPKLRIEYSKFHRHFEPGFCRTTHSVQGMTLRSKFTIHDWDAMDEKLRFVAFSRATGMDGLQIVAKRKDKLDEPVAKRQKAECSTVAEVVQTHGCSIVSGPVNAFEIEAPPVQSQATEDEPMDIVRQLQSSSKPPEPRASQRPQLSIPGFTLKKQSKPVLMTLEEMRRLRDM